MIAVVIPVHNAGPWIEETLRSVQAQTLGPHEFELLLVEDHSNDDSLAKARRMLATANFSYQILETSERGAAETRNSGWRSAKRADWIQFLDADDLLSPTKMYEQSAQLGSLSPDVAVVYSKWQRLALREKRWQPDGIIETPNLSTDPDVNLLEVRGFLQLGAGLIRRTWLEKVGGFDKKYHPTEDVNLLFRIACQGGRFHFVDTKEPGLLYRQLPGSFSRRDPTKFIESIVGTTDLANDHWTKSGKLDERHRRLLIQNYFMATRFFAGKNWKRFAEIEQKILKVEPKFLPTGPRSLRTIARFIGYANAERIALAFRFVKRLFPSKNQG